MKERLIEILLVNLEDRFTPNQLIDIKNTMYSVFQNIDFIPVKNELTIFENTDEKLIQMFLVAKKIDGLSERTLHNYGYTIRNQLRLYINKPIDRITKDDLRLHFAKRMLDNPNISKTTINNERRYFSTFFRWLHDNDYISSNPMTAIKNIKEDRIIKEAFTDEEIEKMREYLSAQENKYLNNSKKDYFKAVRDSAIFECLLSTGCRVSELSGARLNDLNLIRKEMKVFGKGSKERVCYLNSKACMKLEKYLSLRIDDNPFVFVSTFSPYNQLLKSGIEIMIREIGNVCGVKAHPHKFRRTCATNALNKGMPIEEVQIMLGHNQLDTTLIYARVKEKRPNHLIWSFKVGAKSGT